MTSAPPEGDAIEWPSGSIPEIAGAVFDVLVLGSGPERLPGAEPVAGDVRQAPRDGASVRLKGESGDDGAWQFDGVPLGDYGIAVKVDGAWQVTVGLSLSNDMAEGERHDAGELVLQHEEKKGTKKGK